MIVISGGLVLVAIALLIGGLASSGLPLVWASIGVSLLSAVFLAIGVYQRRGEQPTGALASPTEDGKPDAVEGVRTVARTADGPAEADGMTDEAVSAGGTVYVVAGRPRYHVEGCRYLAGKDYEEREVGVALDEGFSACGVCKPDAALATLGATYGDETSADADTATTDSEPDSALLGDSVSLTKTSTRRATTATAPAKKAPAKKAAAARAVPMVVAVADRGKFHRSECRFASSAGAEEMAKAAAKRKGLVACGVCKP